MNTANRNTAILLVFLSIPFGIAIYQDANNKGAQASSRYGYAGLDAYDDPAMAMEDMDYGEDAYDYLAVLDEPEAMDQAFFREVFFAGGDSPILTLSGPLANIKIGVGRDEFERANPGYEDWSYEGIPGYYRVDANAEFEAGKLASFQLSFPDDGSGLETLSDQWGPPETHEDIGAYSWYASSQSLRFSYSFDGEEATVTVARYQTLEDLVAPDKRLFSFEERDVLNLNEAQVQSLLEDTEYDEVSMYVPELREGIETGSAWYQVEGGLVASVNVDVVLDEEDKARMVRLLTAKLGKAKKESGNYETTYRYRQGKRIIEWAVDDSPYGSLSVTRR